MKKYNTKKMFNFNFDKFKLKPFGGRKDWDGDGIPNKKDCQPFNAMRQHRYTKIKNIGPMRIHENPEGKKIIMERGLKYPKIDDVAYIFDMFPKKYHDKHTDVIVTSREREADRRARLLNSANYEQEKKEQLEQSEKRMGQHRYKDGLFEDTEIIIHPQAMEKSKTFDDKEADEKYIKSGKGFDKLKEVTIHEIGHGVHWRVKPLWHKWHKKISLPQKKFFKAQERNEEGISATRWAPTPYGKTNVEEDFAESFAIWHGSKGIHGENPDAVSYDWKVRKEALEKDFGDVKREKTAIQEDIEEQSPQIPITQDEKSNNKGLKDLNKMSRQELINEIVYKYNIDRNSLEMMNENELIILYRNKYVEELNKSKKLKNFERLKKAREYYQRPEIKERKKKYQKEYHQRPEIIERIKEYYQRPEVKKREKEYYLKQKQQRLEDEQEDIFIEQEIKTDEDSNNKRPNKLLKKQIDKNVKIVFGENSPCIKAEKQAVYKFYKKYPEYLKSSEGTEIDIDTYNDVVYHFDKNFGRERILRTQPGKDLICLSSIPLLPPINKNLETDKYDAKKFQEFEKNLKHELQHMRDHRTLPMDDLRRMGNEETKFFSGEGSPVHKDYNKLESEQRAIAAQEKLPESKIKISQKEMETNLGDFMNYQEIKTDEDSKEYKLPDGKIVTIKSNKNVPSKAIVWNVYKNIPDDKNIPIVFQTKKQYLKEYIKNQELKHNIDFPVTQENKYIKDELIDMANISARYTTKNNKYMEPRTVFFTGNKWTPKTFKKTAQHEVGHEIYERNKGIRQDWKSVNRLNSPTLYGTTDKEEDFAESYMLYKNGNLRKGKRLEIIKGNIGHNQKVGKLDKRYQKWLKQNKTVGLAKKTVRNNFKTFSNTKKPLMITQYFLDEEDEEEKQHNVNIESLKKQYPSIEYNFNYKTIDNGIGTGREIIFYKPGQKKRAIELQNLQKTTLTDDKFYNYDFHTKQGILLGYTKKEIDKFNKKIKKKQVKENIAKDDTSKEYDEDGNPETIEEWDEVVKNDPWQIKDHPSPTKEQWTIALERDPSLIKEHPSPTEKQWDKALEKNPYLIEDNKDVTNNQWDEAIKIEPYLIKKHPSPTKEQWDEAIKIEPYLIKKHPSPTKEQWNEAFKIESWMIRDYPSPTKEQWDIAVYNNPKLITEHPSPTEEQWNEAIKQQPYLIKKHLSPTEKQWNIAVKYEPELFQYAKNVDLTVYKKEKEKVYNKYKPQVLNDPTIQYRFNNTDLFDLALYMKRRNIDSINTKELKEQNFSNFPLIKQIITHNQGRGVNYNDLIKFDKQVEKTPLQQFIHDKGKLDFYEWKGGQTAYGKNLVTQLNIPREHIDEFYKITNMKDESKEKVKKYIRGRFHPISPVGDLTLAWVRSTPMGKDVEFIEEVQSDLPRSLDRKDFGIFEEEAFKRFNMLARNRMDKKVLVIPSSKVKQKSKYYGRGGTETIYENYPKRARYTKKLPSEIENKELGETLERLDGKVWIKKARELPGDEDVKFEETEGTKPLDVGDNSDAGKIIFIGLYDDVLNYINEQVEDIKDNLLKQLENFENTNERLAIVKYYDEYHIIFYDSLVRSE